MNGKIDIVKIVGALGTIMGLAATLISGYASDKAMKQEVNKAVKEAVNNLNK